jgi:uncharacterized RDD family membrane protein YckC
MSIAATGVIYPRFSRRVRGMMIDSILVMMLMVVALVVATAFESNHTGRILGFSFVAIWLLYEPVSVSVWGSTAGHYFSNLRVVDDRSGGNINFAKAVLRVLIKSALGWASFISMALTRRHQAIHDVVTRSTVQMRDAARADPQHYRGERTDAPDIVLPSRGRLWPLSWSMRCLSSPAPSLSTGCSGPVAPCRPGALPMIAARRGKRSPSQLPITPVSA